VLIDFQCLRIAGELHASGDADDAHWFTRAEIGELALAKDTAEVVLRGFEKAPERHEL